jgi:non-ribosomal peptide synthetase component F
MTELFIVEYEDGDILGDDDGITVFTTREDAELAIHKIEGCRVGGEPRLAIVRYVKESL